MSGSEPTALLLHGFGGSGRVWARVQARLAIESIAPDLPGFGGAPALADPDVAAYADFVTEQLSALDRPVVLVGASMGGKIALATAARRPDLVDALVLCAPSPPTPEPIDPDQRRRQLCAWGDPDAGRGSIGDTLAKPVTPELFDILLADWLAVDEGAWRWWWEAGSRETIDVSGVNTPTVILGGDADERLGAEAQRRLTLPHLVHARVRSLAGAGHLLPVDDPAAVADAVMAAARRL